MSSSRFLENTFKTLRVNYWEVWHVSYTASYDLVPR